MKYVILLCDGMADTPLAELNNKTVMSVAKKPYMNNLAKHSEIGLVKTVADGLSPGSDVANLSVMGYDPKKYYTGRSPLEAFSIGIDLLDDDVTLRCNLVTLSDDENYSDKTMLDYCADDISTSEAKILIEYIEENLGDDEFKFYSGVSYRHCLVWSKGYSEGMKLIPPHDITDKKVTSYLPQGEHTEKILELMEKSYNLLKDHPVNIERMAKGKRPANSIWLWGEGKKPMLDSFFKKFNKKGSMVSAVDLLKGIAICADMNVCEVEGATGYIDTNFEGKVTCAINELQNGQDFVYIHVEAPDECGHRGEVQNKISAIELIDDKVLAPLIEALEEMGDYSIMILPDHATPLAIKTHTSEPVPYLIYNSLNEGLKNYIKVFDEESAKNSGNFVKVGHTLINKFFK